MALSALVARDGDDRLYYNYAQLMVGQAPDLDYLSTKEQGDPKAARARLQSLITAEGPRLPYRDFPVEYPPVPLLLMLMPRLLVQDYYPYRMVYAALVAGLYLAGGFLAARLARAMQPQQSPAASPPVEAQVWRRLLWMLLATGPLIAQRFDVLPAVLVVAALAALAARRDVLAGAALGLAVMTKLYPLLLAVPIGAFYLGLGPTHRRRVAVVAGASLATIALVAAPFLATAPEAFLRSNALYGARPFHFESTIGAVLFALRGPAILVSSFGSLNVQSPAWLLQLASLLLAGGLGALALAAWRRGRALGDAAPARQLAEVVAWTGATLTFVLCTSKVLSPQFFIWLIPLFAILPGTEGQRFFLFALAILGLTQIFYPPLYGLVRRGSPAAVLVLLLRNGVLVALAALVIRRVWRAPAAS